MLSRLQSAASMCHSIVVAPVPDLYIEFAALPFFLRLCRVQAEADLGRQIADFYYNVEE